MALLRTMLVSASLAALAFIAILFVFSAVSVLRTFELYPHDSSALFLIEVVLSDAGGLNRRGAVRAPALSALAVRRASVTLAEEAAMDSRLALDLFAGILVVAGPVLFIVFCLTFKEDPRDHPIYKCCQEKAHESELHGEMPQTRRASAAIARTGKDLELS